MPAHILALALHAEQEKCYLYSLMRTLMPDIWHFHRRNFASVARRGLFNHARMFLGGYIYARFPQGKKRRADLRQIAQEVFFTGHGRHYFEARSTPSLLANPKYYRRPALAGGPNVHDRLGAAAQRRLAAMRDEDIQPEADVLGERS